MSLMVGWLYFDGILSLVGYLMPNSVNVFVYISNIDDL